MKMRRIERMIKRMERSHISHLRNGKNRRKWKINVKKIESEKNRENDKKDGEISYFTYKNVKLSVRSEKTGNKC